MNKNGIPISKAIVSVRTESNLITTSICPYCQHEDWDYVDDSERNKILLNACTKCDKDYYIQIPDFKSLNK